MLKRNYEVFSGFRKRFRFQNHLSVSQSMATEIPDMFIPHCPAGRFTAYRCFASACSAFLTACLSAFDALYRFRRFLSRTGPVALSVYDNLVFCHDVNLEFDFLLAGSLFGGSNS